MSDPVRAYSVAPATSLTKEQRTLRARYAAERRWAKTKRSVPKAKEVIGRAQLEAFEKEIDPEGKLDPGERRDRAKNAYRAHKAQCEFFRSRVGTSAVSQ